VQRVSVVGVPGSGKSTLARGVRMLRPLTAGEIIWVAGIPEIMIGETLAAAD